jgi:N-methylhydantoinase A
MQFADVEIEHGAGLFTTSTHFDRPRVEAALGALTRGLEAAAVRLETGARRRSVQLSVEARYVGQVWELDVPLPRATLDGDGLAALVEAFHAAHERVFAVRDDATPVEFLAWRARLTVHLDRRRPRGADPRTSPPRAFTARPAHFPGCGLVDTPFFEGPALGAGDCVEGPAVVAEPTTTVVIPPGAAATLSPQGSYLIETGARR